MPQMASSMSLMITFITTFMILNSLNYPLFLYKNKSSTKTTKMMKKLKMMTNLVSAFDPATSINLSLNWLSALLGLLFLPIMFWLIPYRINLMWIKIALHYTKNFKFY